MSLCDLTIAEARELLDERKISAVELVKEHVARMEARRDLNAFVSETPEIALAAAKLADEGKLSGALAGIPLGMKDLFCTKGVRTTACSKILENFVPHYESTVSARMFREGMAMVGKTATDEFAMGSTTLTSYFGPVKNPYSKDGEFLIPGGSSGGSAAAVAAGLCLAATGTDSGGSIRQPAALCGLVGIKPTYGRVSRYGVVAYASSLDCPGVITKSVADAALLMNVIAGEDEMDGTSAPLAVPDYTAALRRGVKGLKIGIPAEYKSDKLHPDLQKAWGAAAEFLKKEGAEIVEVSLPHTKYALPAYYIVAPAEAASNLARYDGVRYGYRTKSKFATLDEMYELTRSEGFGEEVKRRMVVGATILTEEFYERSYLKALKVRRLIRDDFVEAFEKCDAILAPTATGPAYDKDKKLSPVEVYMNDVYTVIANMAGIPAIAVPVAKTSERGLPLGLQFMGRMFDEETLFALAAALERGVKK